MGYIRLFIELKDSLNGNGGGQSRIEILDRSDRGNSRYEIKVRLTAWGLEPNQRCPVSLISISRGRYKRYTLGEMQSGAYGRGEFSFRGLYGAASEPELGAEYFNVIVIENGSRSLQGFRREATPWRNLKDADAVMSKESEAMVQEAEPVRAEETAVQVTAEPETAKEPEIEPETAIQTAAEPEVIEEAEVEPETAIQTAAEPEVIEEGKAEPETAVEPAAEPEVIEKAEAEPETIIETAAEPEATGEVRTESKTVMPAAITPVLKYLFSQHRKVYPFQDISRRWIRIRSEDLSMLPPEAQTLQHSPFVNRACHRYGHLILGDRGENGFTIGVPYRYLPALKEEAESQGFRAFRSIRGGEAGYGEYGYWLRDF